MYQSFEELEVWKRSCQLAVAVYEALRDTREFALRNLRTDNASRGFYRQRIARFSAFSTDYAS
jgi:hypothetical protein